MIETHDMNAVSYEATSEPQQLSADAGPVLWPSRYNGENAHITTWVTTV
tara:strand:+ start:123033 stop:123179 length:147 start_codon:yes stop_codon:yes gene_type:complete